jgi:hypothetical protein
MSQTLRVRRICQILLTFDKAENWQADTKWGPGKRKKRKGWEGGICTDYLHESVLVKECEMEWKVKSTQRGLKDVETRGSTGLPRILSVVVLRNGTVRTASDRARGSSGPFWKENVALL